MLKISSVTFHTTLLRQFDFQPKMGDGEVSRPFWSCGEHGNNPPELISKRGQNKSRDDQKSRSFFRETWCQSKGTVKRYCSRSKALQLSIANQRTKLDLKTRCIFLIEIVLLLCGIQESVFSTAVCQQVNKFSAAPDWSGQQV